MPIENTPKAEAPREAEPIRSLPILSGATYYRIEATELTSGTLFLNPVDANGNVLPSVTLDINADAIENINITLPSIVFDEKLNTEFLKKYGVNAPTLNGRLGFTLKVANSGTESTIDISTIADDYIGSSSSVSLSKFGASAVITPMTEIIWNADVTP